MRSRIPVLLATIAVLVACLLSGKESLAYNAYIVNSYAATTGNGGNGSVSVTDTTTNKVTATIPVGNNPIGVAVAPDGSKVYVANYGDNTVSVIATTTNKVIATISAGADPRGVYGVAVTPDGRWVYATNQGPSSAVPGTTVLVIDTGTNTVSTLITVGKGPAGVAVSPDGSRVYVSNNSDNTVSVIATASNTVTATIPLSSSTVQPFGIAVTPDGSRVYVGAAGDYISVIDATTNTLSATIGVFGEPQYVAITPDGSKVYVTSADYDRVSVIPTATNMVNTTIEPVSGSRPIGVSESPRTAVNSTLRITAAMPYT